MKYIVIKDSGISMSAELYERHKDSDADAPRYVRVARGLMADMERLAKKLNRAITPVDDMTPDQIQQFPEKFRVELSSSHRGYLYLARAESKEEVLEAFAKYADQERKTR